MSLVGPKRWLQAALVQMLMPRPDQDDAFDNEFGTDTSGLLEPKDVGIEDEETREEAILYSPSPDYVTKKLLDRLDIEPRKFNFVDIGSGKGRVPLIAAQRHFRTVLGVEISPHLHEIALANADIFKRRVPDSTPVEFVCADARQLHFPDGDTVFHLYHPFASDLLAEFLGLLQQSLQDAPRQVRIVYLGAWPDVLATLDACTCLELVQREAVMPPYLSWAIYRSKR